MTPSIPFAMPSTPFPVIDLDEGKADDLRIGEVPDEKEGGAEGTPGVPPLGRHLGPYGWGSRIRPSGL